MERGRGGPHQRCRPQKPNSIFCLCARRILQMARSISGRISRAFLSLPSTTTPRVSGATQSIFQEPRYIISS